MTYVSVSQIVRAAVRHTACIAAGWVFGPYVAASLNEIYVAAGLRGDFTWFDWIWRVLLIAAFEWAWYRATRRRFD